MTRPWRLGAPRTCSSAAALPRRGLPADCGFVAHRQRGMATSAGALVAVWRTAKHGHAERRTGRVQHRGAAEILLLRRRRAARGRASSRLASARPTRRRRRGPSGAPPGPTARRRVVGFDREPDSLDVVVPHLRIVSLTTEWAGRGRAGLLRVAPRGQQGGAGGAVGASDCGDSEPRLCQAAPAGAGTGAASGKHHVSVRAAKVGRCVCAGDDGGLWGADVTG